jgi:hypothetical protein
MVDNCSNCGKTGELHITIDSDQYCNSECKKLHRYRPDMTDETYKPNTTIDEIELEKGREWMQIETPDSFYTMFSGYKVIVVQYRMFWHKQLCGFRTVNAGMKAWNKLKQKRNLTSWGDKHKKVVIT